jgi:hypothetical protein
MYDCMHRKLGTSTDTSLLTFVKFCGMHSSIGTII